MWEDVITCYRNLDNDQKAEEIVKRLLGENPDSPKFLCLLGDLQKNPDLYVKAWEKSGARFARAMRSLAAQHYRLKQVLNLLF